MYDKWYHCRSIAGWIVDFYTKSDYLDIKYLKRDDFLTNYKRLSKQQVTQCGKVFYTYCLLCHDLTNGFIIQFSQRHRSSKENKCPVIWSTKW